MSIMEVEDDVVVAKCKESLVERFPTDRSLNLGSAKQSVMINAWRCKSHIQIVGLDTEIILFQFQNRSEKKIFLGDHI